MNVITFMSVKFYLNRCNFI